MDDTCVVGCASVSTWRTHGNKSRLVLLQKKHCGVLDITYGNGNAAVVVDGGSANEHVADGGTLFAKAAGGTHANEQVGFDVLQGKVGSQRCGYGAHIVHVVQRTRAIAHDMDPDAGIVS